MPQPLVSVAMPSFNQVDYIGTAIESILSQNYAGIELIVADGGSTDGTIELLREYSDANPNISWDSTRDSGPAEAISRAFSRARGQFVGWLNSDDAYAPGAINAAVEAFQQNPDWIMCYGHGEHIDQDGNPLGRYPTLRPERGLSAFANGCFICQPTMFMKAVAIKLLGPLDVKLKTAFDYDYWMRAFKAFPDRIGFIESLLAQSRLHSDCLTVRMRETVALEGLALGQRHLNASSSHWAVTYLEELRESCAEDQQSFLNAARGFLDQSDEFLDVEEMRKLRRIIGA